MSSRHSQLSNFTIRYIFSWVQNSTIYDNLLFRKAARVSSVMDSPIKGTKCGSFKVLSVYIVIISVHIAYFTLKSGFLLFQITCMYLKHLIHLHCSPIFLCSAVLVPLPFVWNTHSKTFKYSRTLKLCNCPEDSSHNRT